MKKQILDTIASGLKSEREIRNALPNHSHAEIEKSISELVADGKLEKDFTPSRGVIYSFPSNAVEVPMPPLEEGVPAIPEEAPFPETEPPTPEPVDAPTPEDIAQYQAADSEPEVKPKTKKRWSLTSKK